MQNWFLNLRLGTIIKYFLLPWHSHWICWVSPFGNHGRLRSEIFTEINWNQLKKGTYVNVYYILTKIISCLGDFTLSQSPQSLLRSLFLALGRSPWLNKSLWQSDGTPTERQESWHCWELRKRRSCGTNYSRFRKVVRNVSYLLLCFKNIFVEFMISPLNK